MAQITSTESVTIRCRCKASDATVHTLTLKELYTHISYYDDDYDNEDSIVSDVEVEPVITLGNNQPQRDDLEEMSVSGHVWHDEEIASVPERADQMKR